MSIAFMCRYKMSFSSCVFKVGFSKSGHVLGGNFSHKICKIISDKNFVLQKFSVFVFCSLIFRRMYFDNHQMCYYL